MTNTVSTVLGACIGCLLALLILYLAPQIDVPDIKYTGVNVSVSCSLRTSQILCMCRIDMRYRLSLLDERCQYIIHFLDAFRCLVNSFST